jgi:hypothetical protein
MQTLKRIVLGIGSVVLILMGANSLLFALTTTAPTPMTCAALAAAKPTSAWVKLSECDLDLAEAMIHTSSGKVEHLLIPMRAPGTVGPTSLVLSVSDSDILAKADKADSGGKDNGMGAIMLLAEVSRRVDEKAGISGFVGMSFGGVNEKKMEGKSGISRNPVVVEFNQKPGAGMPLIMLAGGLIVLAFVLFGMGKAQAEAPAMPAPAPRPSRAVR